MIIENNGNLTFLPSGSINFKIGEREVSLKRPIGLIINRYYLPLFDFVRQIGGSVFISDGEVYIKLSNDPPVLLICSCIYAYRDFYISLLDFCNIFNFKTKWDYDSKSITLQSKNDNTATKAKKEKNAYIRIEDITAGNNYVTSDSLEKLQAVGELLYSAGTAFHIAWIPKFVDPPNGIDNDISKTYSIPNSHFVFTMDYLLRVGGVIGLHGYTHQYGDEVSAYGTEFSKDQYNDEYSVRTRIESAIEIANNIGFPYSFFESPHYASTEFQQSIYENYFDIIYECYVGIWGDKVVKSPRNNKTIYVPTPLGYVEGENGTQEMINKINNLDDKTLASLFYHPYLEFNYITFGSDVVNIKYDGNSPLHQIINSLFEKGYSLSNITGLL